MRILAINCGSSSVKFLYGAVEDSGDLLPARILAQGTVAGIGAEASLRFRANGGREAVELISVPDHARAMRAIFMRLDAAGWLASGGPHGIGHRIVHGGPGLAEPILLNGEVLGQIEAASNLAPLHNDASLAAIRATRAALGHAVPMVGVFDTAYHHNMPEWASRYAIRLETADEHGIRRYGFHGLAHRSMMEQCAERIGRPAEQLKLITLQLGNGCSAAAIDGGQSVDTSMGFTPLEGLVMGTRSGDIDPAVVRFLGERTNQSAAEVELWLNRQCGLSGVSGASRDVRELLLREADGDTRAALALEMFCYRVRKYIGAYLAALGGADAVVFGGGIGENSPEIRERICRGMAWCGLRIDAHRNAEGGTTEGEIGVDGASVRLYAVKVNEEFLIARDTADCLRRARQT